MKKVHGNLAMASIYVALYLLLEWGSHVRAVLAPGITPWHPQAGLTVAFLFVLGPRWAFVTLFAAFAGDMLVRESSASVVVLAAAATCIALAYGSLAGVLRRLLAWPPLHTTAQAATFAGVSVFFTLAAATAVIACYLSAGEVASGDALRGLARYWLADLNGVLMLTPLLVSFAAARSAIWRAIKARPWEVAAQSGLVLVLLTAIFALPTTDQLRFLYLLFIPIVWIALRWNWAGALTAVLLIQSVLIAAAEADVHTPRFIDLQFLMLTLSVTALVMGAVVAERRQSETQLRDRDMVLARAMRFAMAGELASALAHELNQPITALVSYVNASEILANESASESERLRSTLRKASHEAIRASDMLRRLRDFYVGGAARREKIEIAALCKTVAAAFDDRLRQSDTALELVCDTHIPAIEGDGTQLEIILHNLFANALDATAQRAVRRVKIRAWANDEQVNIEVDDSGPGVAAEVESRLFEAFVTNKTDGMGLGLAISRTLARARGGEILTSRSDVLGGSRFTLTLPMKLPNESEHP